MVTIICGSMILLFAIICLGMLFVGELITFKTDEGARNFVKTYCVSFALMCVGILGVFVKVLFG